jgi:hypothetical protein
LLKNVLSPFSSPTPPFAHENETFPSDSLKRFSGDVCQKIKIYFSAECLYSALKHFIITTLNYFSFIYSTQHCFELKYVAAGFSFFIANFFSKKGFIYISPQVFLVFISKHFLLHPYHWQSKKNVYLRNTQNATYVHVYFSRSLLLCCCISLDASIFMALVFRSRSL